MTLNKEISKYKEIFFDLYNKDVLPKLKYYDAKRKETLFKCSIITASTLATLIPAIVFFVKSDEFREFAPILLLWLVPLGVASFLSDSFVTDLKTKFYTKLLPTLGNIRWDNNGSLDDGILRNSELFSKFTDYIIYDAFFGTYKSVAFRAVEAMLTGESGTNVFKGVILLFKSNKKIKNKTIIGAKNDRFLNKSKNSLLVIFYTIIAAIFLLLTILCFLTKDLSIMIIYGPICLFFSVFIILTFKETQKKMHQGFKFEKMQEIKLEYSVFDKKFTAYSSDQIEGRYLITSSFMERLVHLQKIFGTKKIKCSFVDDIIIFAIPTYRNVFEIGSIFKPLTKIETMEHFFNEITAIYLLIDHFKLNEKTGL